MTRTARKVRERNVERHGMIGEKYGGKWSWIQADDDLNGRIHCVIIMEKL